MLKWSLLAEAAPLESGLYTDTGTSVSLMTSDFGRAAAREKAARWIMGVRWANAAGAAAAAEREARTARRAVDAIVCVCVCVDFSLER